jgi:hypothetical protein
MEISKIKSHASIMEKVCVKCGKDFSCDPSWTSSLRRHLSRKNPCDRPPDISYIKDSAKPGVHEIHVLDSVIVPKNLGVAPRVHSKIAPWFFEKVFSEPSNVCFVRPNKSKPNEIVVKVSKDSPVQVVSLNEFVRLFVNHVLLKNFSCDDGYEMFLCDNSIYTVMKEWNGVFSKGDGFMEGLLPTVKSFLDCMLEKTHLKNILLRM